MIAHRQWNRQSADRAEVPLRPLLSLAVKLFLLEFRCALLECLLVMLAVGPLAVHATVLHEAAGRAFLELDGAVFAAFATVGAHAISGVVNCSATHASTE